MAKRFGLALICLPMFLACISTRSVVDENPEVRFFKMKLNPDEDLQISKNKMSESAARDEIRSRVELLRKYLSKQMDPYRGVPEDTKCAVPEAVGKTILEDVTQLSMQASLLASPAHAIDCYGNTSRDQLKLIYMLLYCKKNQELFEIHYYLPLEKSFNEVPLAQCAP